MIHRAKAIKLLMATAPPTIGSIQRTMTVREWAALDADLGFDLVNGQLVRIPQVAIWHDILINRLVAFLYTHIMKHRLGDLPGQKSRLRISLVGGREPDLFFIPRELFHLVGLNLFTGIPPLVIEVLSPSNEDTDRLDKYLEYAQLGIPEYWIVDFPNRCLEVHRLITRPDG